MTGWRAVPIQIIGQNGATAALRFGVRLAVLGAVVLAGLILLLILRIVERPVFGEVRPWTPFLTQGVCRLALRIIGLPVSVTGTPMHRPGATVSNHVSWLDIFVLNASERVYFVAKSEVASWALIGWLARATGTMFIARKGTEAKAQQLAFETRLHLGHRLLFFPEGTSSDGMRVLPFKSTLFAAFLHPHLKDDQSIQPVTLIYHAPLGQDARFYGWWAEMDFATSFRDVLRQWPQGRVEVVYHPPLRVSDYADRKSLTAACEAAVRSSHPSGAISDD
jgi:lyso-ornithine lipid O-acyltransferase